MSSVKPFVLACTRCKWREAWTGITADVQHLHEIPRACHDCGRPRTFRCPECGMTAKALRVRGNT